MSRVFKLCVILSLINNWSFGQVINVESMRKKTDSARWSGSIGLDLGLIKNTNSIFRISTKAHVQYNNKKVLWLFINDLNFQKLEDSSFVNKGIQHLRFNRTLTQHIKIEIFAQAQYDAISEIDFRGLLGLGPRFKLSKNDDYRFYLGTLVMYEYEKASKLVENRVKKNIRGSVYLSVSLYPTDNITFINTCYYQPRFESFKDYRLSNDTSLLFKIFKGLAFKSTFSYNFDALPVTNKIPKAQYELTNGLLFDF